MPLLKVSVSLFGGDQIFFEVNAPTTVSGATTDAGTQVATKAYALQGNVPDCWGATCALATDARTVIKAENLDSPLAVYSQLNIIGVWGQSNARSEAVDVGLWTVNPAAQPYMHLLGLSGGWQPSTEPSSALPCVDAIQTSQGDGGFSFCSPMLEQIVLARPDEHWAVVPFAVGGTSLSQWGVSNTRSTYYGGYMARMRQALTRTNAVLRAMLVYQGETDTIVQADALAWASRFQAIADAQRVEFGAFPYIVTQIRSDLPAGTHPYVAEVRAQQASVARSDQIVVPSTEAPGTINADNVHLNQQGQLDNASLYATAVLANV